MEYIKNSMIKAYNNRGNLYFLDNITAFDITYKEITNTHLNECGRTFVYPVRAKKRCIKLELEANSESLKVLMDIFTQYEITLAIMDVSFDSENYQPESQYIKTSEISVIKIANEGNFGGYPDKGGYQLPDGKGLYNFSVSLEEI